MPHVTFLNILQPNECFPLDPLSHNFNLNPPRLSVAVNANPTLPNPNDRAYHMPSVGPRAPIPIRPPDQIKHRLLHLRKQIR